MFSLKNQQNERIYYSLNNLPWFFMTRADQQNLGSLLHRMQNGLRLTIGPLGELNYEMATTVKQTISCPIFVFNLHIN